ncbi:phosphonate metabolism transcriptional regulator PhnF (plasmid) [Sinorhizobium meliloti]|uniref:phosphonate metabolism transcriptional regulator PhnF n=1 Tax=Rhizobium meliloti TaxID=382 RepID=UPI000B49700C|nr:phosphonate metabolism transcriptional regulator PhnF [Sinorhizobium meliloti]ASP89681.1 phosphonate metabolism transcriptional regulator PhnF [Sinorhizobium meliloti]MQW25556.1 phosphonate metabolism transcriptional regulator PhnF [Sinorhizobium meliloti]
MKRWEVVRSAILSDIEAGAFEHGRLPGDLVLAERFGVNRHTVRSAIKVLESEGALRVQHGVGTFVADDFVAGGLSSGCRFTYKLLGQNKTLRAEILSINEAPVEAEVAKHLNIAPTAMITELRSVSFIGDLPLRTGTSYFPKDRVPGLVSAFEGADSFAAALNRCGITEHKRKWTRITARRPTPQEAQRLRISSFSPVLFETNVDVTPDGLPIKCSFVAIRSDRYEYLVEGKEDDIGGSDRA